MGAGQPDWNRLNKMGKLPQEQRGQIPMLEQLDQAEQRMKTFEEGCCDDCRAKFFSGAKPKEETKEPEKAEDVQVVTLKCEHEGCEYEATGQTQGMAENALRLHAKKHEPKPQEKKEAIPA